MPTRHPKAAAAAAAKPQRTQLKAEAAEAGPLHRGSHSGGGGGPRYHRRHGRVRERGASPSSEKRMPTRSPG